MTERQETTAATSRPSFTERLSRPSAAKPFAGPWEAFEVLDEEFRLISRRFPVDGRDPWRVRPEDVLRAREALLRAAALQLTDGAVTTCRNARPEDRDAAAALLNDALALPPARLVERCTPFLQSGEGLALAHAVGPYGAGELPPEGVTRFNRQVLDVAFAGLLRAAPERALAELLARDVTQARERLAAGSPRTRWALCLSGGGIRSASFSLGVLQSLAQRKLLPRFDYLSTVSGGGYIGSWLTAWMARDGRVAVSEQLGGSAEPAPVGHLRRYLNYLTPRLGVGSADEWALAATVVRNLLLNWLVVVPALAALLMLPLLAASVLAYAPDGRNVFAGALALVAFGFVGTVLGVRFVHSHRPEQAPPADGAGGTLTEEALVAERRRARGRGDRAFVVACLLPIAAAATSLSLAWAWLWKAYHFIPNHGYGRELPALWVRMMDAGDQWTVLLLFGIASHLVGWLLSLQSARSHGLPLEKPGRLAREAAAIVGTGALAGGVIYFTGLGILYVSAMLPRTPLARPLASLAASVGVTAFDLVYALLGFPAFVFSLVLAGYVFSGVTSALRSEQEQEWSSRYSGWLMLVASAWGALALLVILHRWAFASAWQGLSTVGVAGVAGWAAAMLGSRSDTGGARAATGVIGRLREAALGLVAPVAVLAVLLVIASLDVWLLRYVRRVEASPFLAALALADLLLLLSIAMSRFIDVNQFSLHAMYRARLVRAYLGASRPAGMRAPNPFTGFDPADDARMSALHQPDAPAEARPPIHLLNLTLNVTASPNLAWQERKARPFTVSPLHAGAAGLGYRRTSQLPGTRAVPLYGDATEGLSLGTAMAISGAAASPNMGYHSSPAVAFLMTMFNARLGWWLGNPGWAGSRSYDSARGTHFPSPIFWELLGRSTDAHSLVHLSDGGHFENLGLYEVVRRRCGMIFVVDASCDGKTSLEDLGNTLRKIEVDLGIPIELKPLPQDATGGAFVWGTVRYSVREPAREDGALVYVKPSRTAFTDPGVASYGRTHLEFPHESTTDQFFSESQFESYRKLGWSSMEGALGEVAKELADVRIGRFRDRDPIVEPADAGDRALAFSPDLAVRTM